MAGADEYTLTPKTLKVSKRQSLSNCISRGTYHVTFYNFTLETSKKDLAQIVGMILYPHQSSRFYKLSRQYLRAISAF